MLIYCITFPLPPPQSSCDECEDGASHTIRGSSNRFDCVCTVGRYNASAYSKNPAHNPDFENGVVNTGDSGKMLDKVGYYYDCPLVHDSHLVSVLPPRPVCLRCPDGASCDGGSTIPVPNPDYWGEREFPTKFFSCVSGRCEGGWDDATNETQCERGYEDVQCANCEDGYSLVNGVCEHCNSWAHVREAVGIPLIILLWALVSYVCMDSPGLDLSLAFFQKVSVLLAFGVRWPEELVEVRCMLVCFQGKQAGSNIRKGRGKKERHPATVA